MYFETLRAMLGMVPNLKCYSIPKNLQPPFYRLLRLLFVLINSLQPSIRDAFH